MEIGTEISKKIRAAIKGKLQELGAYVDEELPDYIMVMVANKKNAQQMADDLSLFLGNNTIKFTVWLHGVLEKLRSVAVEPTSIRPQLDSDTSAPISKSRDGERRGEDSRALAVSSSRSDRTEARVSSSAYDNHSRRGSSDKNASRLTSAVKPLMEPHSVEAIIDIKPDLDDDLIAEVHAETSVTSGRPPRVTSGRSAAELHRSRVPPGASSRSSGRMAESYRPSEERLSSAYGRSSRSSGSRDEMHRKRKAPVASSVVRVHRGANEGQDSDDVEDDDDDDEEEYGSRSGVSSRVSLPSKPERKPSLPPGKQANKNLILKAISDAQQSITKTTSYTTSRTTGPRRQTVPVAPRTRPSSEEMKSAIRFVQEQLQGLITPEAQLAASAASVLSGQSRSLSSRLQVEEVPEDEEPPQQPDYGTVIILKEAQLCDMNRLKAFDTRSFIVKRPELEETPSVRSRLGTSVQLQEVPSTTAPTPTAAPTTPLTPLRMVQPRERPEVAPASPKFIVTLDGVPSPLASRGDQDMDVDDSDVPRVDRAAADPPGLGLKIRERLGAHQRLQKVVSFSDEEDMDAEDSDMMDQEPVPVKRQKVLERCKFWPVCKSGDDCVYHHPTTQCKTFPNCKFGDKCLFVHPNCKFDAKCKKPDCPFTHVSRRGAPNLPRPVAAVAAAQPPTICRFFPDCKKMDCPFYHPKPCRFAGQCKRQGCSFYHPSTSVPPRHALKWTKTQSS
ncbi:zinc finger CCCH domain-containing protein 14 isoform X1 [Alosa sapidissima]|uniref:zinc finger CCCH domain-containing protein 14 isoform X1 n=1 Tax=Alosa sapidissima TaxID=34773 RepID=UPI001C0855EC|nr:zinc finger CCCH domain-containing protein 14 isoform X1 [Alosa sapidissima]